ncbi:MAG: hypothetical protein HRU19_26740 [Pseudobacteriovorax sp.]|nr:hypothetical protein [Pseudobacteriovorax sp.]
MFKMTILSPLGICVKDIVSRTKYFYSKILQKNTFDRLVNHIQCNLMVGFSKSITSKQASKIAKTVILNRCRMDVEDYLLDNWGMFKFFGKTRGAHEKIGSINSLRVSSVAKNARKYPFKNEKLIDQAMSLKKGLVICAFHSGHYRNLPPFLMSLGYKVNLLVDKTVYTNSSDCLSRPFFLDESGQITRCKVIDVQESGVGFKLIETLRKGEIVLFFLDGNKGSGDISRNTMPISFLDQKINVKAGAIQIALMNEAPIINANMWFSKFGVAHYHFSNVDLTNLEGSLRNRSKLVINYLYDDFQKRLTKFPELWDEWPIGHFQWHRNKRSQTKLCEKKVDRIDKILSDNWKCEKLKIRLNTKKVFFLFGKTKTVLVERENSRFSYLPDFLVLDIKELASDRWANFQKLKAEWKKNHCEEKIKLELKILVALDYIDLET